MGRVSHGSPVEKRMKADKRLDVKLSLVITDNETPYVGVLEIEKKLITFLTEMNQLGYAQLSTVTPPAE